MSDLISRQAAIELIKNNSYTIKHGLNDVEKGMTLYGIIQALEYLPSVQPKTGHWRDTITAGINETVCSVCLYSGFHHFNYCPNCGAKMEEKRNETKRA